MTEQEVVALLGNPLEKYTARLGSDSIPGWAYSKSAHDASYRVRCILFRDGKVYQIIREFYLD